MITEAHKQPSDRQSSSALSKKILIAGYYGFSNTGDEAILSAMLTDLRSQRPELEFIIVSGNPDETAARYNVSSVLYTDWNEIIESARRCDLIILGGGGLFHDYWGFDPHTLLTRDHWSISFYSAFPLLATLLDKPLMLFAIGVGPLMSDAGRKYTYFAFDQAWVSTVRDIESKESLLSPCLDETRIKVTADPAYLITPSPKERAMDLLESEGYSSSGEWLIGVSLRKWDIGVQQDKWTREVANALDIMIERYKAKVVFLPFQRASEKLTDDYAISTSVRSLMRNQSQTFTLEKDYTVEETAGILAQCNIVLGMRLHSIIFAANAGVPVLGLVYDPKVRNVMCQLGCEKYAMDLSATNAVELLRLFENAYRNHEKISATLQSATESLRQLAKENAILALDLLDNPARYRPVLSREILDLLKGTTLRLALRAETNNQIIDALERTKEVEVRDLTRQQAEKEQAVNQLTVQLAEKEQAANQLTVQLAEQRRAVNQLTVQLAEQEQILQSLSARMSEQEQEIQTLSSQVAEAEQTARDLSEHRGVVASLTAQLAEHEEARSADLAEHEKLVKTLTALLAETERTTNAFSAKAAEAEQATAALTVQLRDKEGAISSLSGQLAQKEQELEEITSTLGWRLLNAYGPIKYRYLLPIYRMLGLAPYKRESRRKKHPGHTLTPASASSPAVISQVHEHPGEPVAQAPAAQELDELRTALSMEFNAYDVVCFPIIDWDFRFQRPQQLMSRFASAGHRVFYLSQEFRASGAPYVIVEKSHNVYGVSLCGQPRNVYTESLNDRSRDELFNSIDALRRDLSLGATVAFVQLPFWWPLVDKTRAEFAWPIVYDCMDHHAGFSTNRPTMIDQERGLLASADLVVVSSSFLKQEAERHNSTALLVRNGCEYEHFAKASARTGERPVIGYYGAIADWFDSDLVADLAERRPDWDFVLVGSTFSADTSRLSKLPNVSLPGEKHYSTIPDWLGTFDAAILPFKRIPLTEATNPVKAYEILASGKPLISVPIPEMASLAPLVRLASTVEEFEREILAALKDETEEIVEQRRNFAKENTWEKRYDELAPAVRGAFAKVSIIIVTFNSLELNRLCLESLYARTEWPNYEVIVVDNGSSDETPQYLKEAEKTFPNLRVILNRTNLGFAPANNIGVEQATGEYLVLLNNDTIVTRGWLSSLIRRLNADPKIGLIGPVTNAIANEAKVEVGYQRIGEMTSWAASYVREHDGEVYPIHMLAMFCVAMRRKVFEEVGPLDERFAVGMFEDDDYCRRIRALGYKLVCARDSFIHHWQRASFRLLGEDEYLRVYHENRRKYEQKWQDDRPSSSTLQGASVDERYREQLNTVLERVRASKGVVIFLPSIGWNIHLFQRPHHLARTFAENGYVSIFDSSNSHDDVNGFEEIAPNLFLFHGSEDILHEIPDPILWTFPYNLDRKDGYPSTARTIYDWIDDLDVFPYDRALLERNHRRGLRESTVVACVARALHEQALAVRRDAIYLPNGVEYERFAGDSADIPDDRDLADFRREGKPIAGYYGALAEWFDYELLDEVARLRPDWNFVLIGQALDESIHRQASPGRANVKWIGPRPYESLPGYLRLFDVAMIPFKINRITEATSPLKLYEYMAGGKPIITTPMPECQSFAAVNIARDAEEFAHALDSARKQGLDPEFRAQLRATARKNSWAARVGTVTETLERAGEQAVSPAQIESSASAAPSPAKADSKSPALANVSNAAASAALVGETVPVESRETSAAVKLRAASEPELTGAAAKIADRFRHFRTPNNAAFFNALAAHFARIESNPCLPMYFEFAITCNARGRQVVEILRGHTALLHGKRYLDVGCAYGGFLVAFAEQGSQVTGIDIDEMLLRLARTNLRDNQLDVPLLVADATRAEQLNEFGDSFDVITCNDVIEHVEDPQLLLANLAAMLRSDGLVYFEIPNRYAPRHVMRDGHYQLFGITLLDYPEARDYYAQHAPGAPYTTRHYLSLDQYAEMFAREGMQLEILEANYQNVDLETALNDMIELRDGAQAGLSGVPPSLRPLVRERLANYLREIEACPRATESERRDFLLRYGMGFWRVLGRKRPAPPGVTPPADAEQTHGKRFAPIEATSFHPGLCNVCGRQTSFHYSDPALYRESLVCPECGTTSRYRSIARGILRAIRELTGVEAANIAELATMHAKPALKIYDTQAPFYFAAGAYPIPDLLARCQWLDVRTSLYRPQQRLGKKLGPKITNQNLEALKFPDNRFDIVVTSDVMEHVRLDFRAHQEIRRVLKPGGVYLFTVPHLRDRRETFYRVAVVDPADPAKDIFLTEKEYHGDANADDGRALSYRAYGTDLDETLQRLGFAVDYCKTDFPRAGIMNTELFFCRLVK
jgi:polysaccharide pyruvyl transferase CsaB